MTQICVPITFTAAPGAAPTTAPGATQTLGNTSRAQGEPDDSLNQSLEQALTQSLTHAQAAKSAGANCVEFRVDNLPNPELGLSDDAIQTVLTQLIQQSPLPSILTCRMAEEGGACTATDDARAKLYTAAGRAQAAYVDIELASYERSIALRQAIDEMPATTRVIFSTHDFQTRPSDLTRRIAAMHAIERCDVVKAAWTARSLRDNLEAFELIQTAHKPAIMLCMGETGLPSRVLAKKFGALLTFARLDETGTAPGQPTVKELKTLYRWDRQNPATKVYGVIGHPIGHSMSPAIHNQGFDAIDYDGVYLLLPIPDAYESFKATVASWLDYQPLDFQGASVTIPHKANLLRFVKEQNQTTTTTTTPTSGSEIGNPSDSELPSPPNTSPQTGQVEPLAQNIGAANTLTRHTDNSLTASNTDYAAILDSVTATLSTTREDLKGQTVAVLGAGGAARAAVAGFTSLGCHVCIYNRTAAKADELAQAFTQTAKDAGGSVRSAPLSAIGESLAEIYINCTPLGMHPKTDASPFDEHTPDLSPGTVIFDTIYNPAQTKLLEQAWQNGCLPIPGTEMFVRQAAVQFEGWTNQQAPLHTFRQVLNDKLQQH